MPLKDIVKMFSGGTPSKSNSSFWIGTIPWVSPKDFKTIYISDSEDHVSETAIKSSSTKLVPSNSILVVVRSGILQHTLPVAVNTRPVTINQDVKALIPSCNVLPEYLAYYLNIFQHSLLPLITKHSTTVQSINTDEFENLEIPIPEKNVQKKIKTILDIAYGDKEKKKVEANQLLTSIDSYILQELGIKPSEQRPKKIYAILASQLAGQRYDPLFYSQEVFKNIRTAKYGSDLLENLIDDAKSGFAAGKADQELVDVDDAIIQIRPTNIDEHGQFIFERNVYISKEQLQTREKDLLQKGEVLFNNTNSQEQVGKTAYFDLEGQYFCSNHITRIMTKSKKLDPVFLYVILNLYQNIRVFYNICTNWNNQSGVNVELLSSLPIPTPSLAIQQRIAEEVQSRIERAKQLKQEALDDLQTAKAQVERLILGEAG
jgi:type I restriction enzyme S subunit